VLRLIEQHPEDILELPECCGVKADLSRIDLSRKTLRARVRQSVGLPPKWWYPGPTKNHQGAYLVHANLQGAYLRSANLTGAVLGEAELGNTDLIDAVLEGASLSHAQLPKAQLWRADLRNAILANANLQEAELPHADLRDANLYGADLQKAKLVNAKLQTADLRTADLISVDLRGARLENADLSDANMANLHLSGARLERTRLQWDDLKGQIAEETDATDEKLDAKKRARKYGEAKRVYVNLKQNFEGLGDYGCCQPRLSQRAANGKAGGRANDQVCVERAKIP